MKIWLAIMCAALMAVPAGAQFWPWAETVNHDLMKLRDEPDDGWVFCRLKFHRNRSEMHGNGWLTDYPGADRNFTIRFGELTTIRTIEKDNGDPIHWAVDADNRVGLSRCPWMMANDVGVLEWQDTELEPMREWFAKGGFLWVDDFWGRKSWEQWTRALMQVIPGAIIAEIEPDHAIYRMWHPQPVPQVSNLNYWRGTGQTAERGGESPRAEVWGAWTRDGHLAVFMTFNTDIGDTWEREGDDPSYFDAFSPDGYAVGLNVLLYAMSH